MKAVTKKNNENILLSYESYGYGKIGYSKYCFSITDDFRAKMDISIQQELSEKNVSTEYVSLTAEEIELVQEFMELELSAKKLVPFYGYGLIEMYEGFRICYQKDGEHIVRSNEYELKAKIDAVKTFIQNNHDEISQIRIASLYNELSEKMYSGFTVDKQLVKI